MCLFRYNFETKSKGRRSSSRGERHIASISLFFFYENTLDSPSKIYVATRYADALSKPVRSARRETMEVLADGRPGKRHESHGSRRYD
jgi:hypothetical protein